MNDEKRAQLINQYMNTSVDDMKCSVATVTDGKLLIELYYRCTYGFPSKAKIVHSRICKLIKAGADHV